MEWYQKLGIEIASEKLTTLTNAALQAERKAVVQGLRNLLDAADAESRDISSQEEKIYKQAEGYLTDIESEISRRPANVPAGLVGGTYRSEGARMQPMPQYGIVGASYGRLFHGRDDFRAEPVDVETYCRQVAANSVPIDTRTMQEGVGSEGGFTVPEFWAGQIFQEVQEESFALSRCRLYNMQSNILHVPAWSSSDRSTGFFGGVEVEKLAEAQTATLKTPQLRTVTLGAHKYGIYINLSREVIEDSNSLAASLGPMMVMGLSETLDEKILTGSGVGESWGLINSKSAITISRATASTVTFADLVNMRSRIFPSFAKNAVWLIAPDVLGALLQLEDTGGSLIFVPPLQGVSGNVPMKLLGNDLFITDKLGGLGEKGDVVLADLSQVALGMRGQIILQRSDTPFYTSDLTTFRALVRFDSVPLLDSEIVPRTGSTTLSWCAILE